MTDKQLPAVTTLSSTKGGDLLPIANFQDLSNIAALITKSGLAGDVRPETYERKCAETAVKIMAGHEYGLTPFKATRAFHVVEGKATPTYQFVGHLIKTSGKYRYNVKKQDDDGCILQWSEFIDGKWQIVGDSQWLKADAEKCGQSEKPTYRRYPKQFNFARALTNGANVYCPDLFGGPVYVAEDFGEVVDAQETETRTEKPVEEPAAKKRSSSKKQENAVEETPISDTSTATSAPAPEHVEVEVVDETPKPAAQESSAGSAPTTDAVDEAPKPSEAVPAVESAQSGATATGAETVESTASVTEAPSTTTGATEAPKPAVGSAATPNPTVSTDASARPGEKEITELVQLGENLGLDKKEINQVLIGHIVSNKVVPADQHITTFKDHWTFDDYNAIVAAVKALKK